MFTITFIQTNQLIIHKNNTKMAYNWRLRRPNKAQDSLNSFQLSISKPSARRDKRVGPSCWCTRNCSTFALYNSSLWCIWWRRIQRASNWNWRQRWNARSLPSAKMRMLLFDWHRHSHIRCKTFPCRRWWPPSHRGIRVVEKSTRDFVRQMGICLQERGEWVIHQLWERTRRAYLTGGSACIVLKVARTAV